MAPEAAVFDEANLVAQARHGNTGAFGELAERYQRNIFRLAQNITQNREDAEDVLQETFMKAYEHLPDFEGNSKFYTWLVRIAVNEALMKLRKRKWDKTVWLDEPVNVGEDNVAREIAVWEDNPSSAIRKRSWPISSRRRSTVLRPPTGRFFPYAISRGCRLKRRRRPLIFPSPP